MQKAIRIKKGNYNHFLVINTDAILDLSPKAFYLLCYEQDQYYKGYIKYDRKSAYLKTKLGENVYNQCIKELKEKGYLTIKRIHNELWGSDYEYNFFAKDEPAIERIQMMDPKLEKVVDELSRRWTH